MLCLRYPVKNGIETPYLDQRVNNTDDGIVLTASLSKLTPHYGKLGGSELYNNNVT